MHKCNVEPTASDVLARGTTYTRGATRNPLMCALFVRRQTLATAASQAAKACRTK